MKAVPVKAHQIASITSARSADGRFGLIRFVREAPLQDGTTDLWMAVPTNLLPYLATVAVKALPQPEGGTVPHVLAAQGVALGVGSGGELVLTVTLEKGATLSYQLDPAQAAALHARLSDVLAKPGTNGTAKAKAKAKPPAKPNGKPRAKPN